MGGTEAQSAIMMRVASRLEEHGFVVRGGPKDEIFEGMGAEEIAAFMTQNGFKPAPGALDFIHVESDIGHSILALEDSSNRMDRLVAMSRAGVIPAIEYKNNGMLSSLGRGFDTMIMGDRDISQLMNTLITLGMSRMNTALQAAMYHEDPFGAPAEPPRAAADLGETVQKSLQSRLAGQGVVVTGSIDPAAISRNWSREGLDGLLIATDPEAGLSAGQIFQVKLQKPGLQGMIRRGFEKENLTKAYDLLVQNGFAPQIENAGYEPKDGQGFFGRLAGRVAHTWSRPSITTHYPAVIEAGRGLLRQRMVEIEQEHQLEAKRGHDALEPA